jgi:hypothetical protein
VISFSALRGPHRPAEVDGALARLDDATGIYFGRPALVIRLFGNRPARDLLRAALAFCSAS